MNTKKKYFIFVYFMFFLTSLIYCGGNTQFSVSGQTNYQLSYGQSSVNATLDFTYWNYNNNIDYSFLSATLDGSTYMMYDYEPPSRTFSNLGVGTHTIVLKLNQGYNGSGPSHIFDQHTVTITVEAAPQPPAAPQITSDSYSSNQWVHFAWSSVQGAVSYNVYRTGQIQGTLSEGANNVGNTTDVYDYPYSEPTFSTFVSASFGFASYYVTAVNSSGIESAPSNSVTWGVSGGGGF